MDFPCKTLVLTLVATLALVGVAWYAATVPATRSAGAARRREHSGRRDRQPDRSRHGRLRPRLRRRLLARLALLGVQRGRRRHLDRRRADDSRSSGAGTPCIQSCLSSDRSPSTRTACCWPPPICSACGWRRGARGRRASTATRCSTSASGSSSRALVGAKALLFVVDFEQFTSSWQEFTTLLRSGGVFYGGLIAAVVVCIYQLRKHKLPLWTSGDLFAPGIALGYMVGRLGCLMAGCCYGKPTDVPWAITFTDPAAQPQRRHAAQRAAAPDAALRVAGRADHPRAAARARAARPRSSRAGRSGCSCCSIRSRASSSSSTAATIAAWSFGVLSTSQFISVVLAPLSLIMLWYLSRPAQPPAAETPRGRKAAFA